MLRDGSPVIVRQLERDDEPLVQAVFDAMGKEMRYRRFLGYKKQPSAQDLETLTAVDHHGHEARVAVHAETGEPWGSGGQFRSRDDRTPPRRLSQSSTPGRAAGRAGFS